MKQALVLFGISGDLSKRKLIPALLQLEAAGQLPDEFRILGVSRRELDVDSLLAESLGSAPVNTAATLKLRRRLEMLQFDVSSPKGYTPLADRLAEVAPDGAGRLFYISLPPQVSLPIIENLGSCGLNADGSKLLLEKPFGVSLESAQDFIVRTTASFNEEQIYRIDHYLAKEMAQNISIFKERNPAFSYEWSNKRISAVTVAACEEIGIEGRASFYENTGALRDVLQSHLMQLLALTLSLPGESGSQSRLDALQSLEPADPRKAVRGQYLGYREEVDNSDSTVETFASVELRSGETRWKGVPLRLITGKGLDRKMTEIRIEFESAGKANCNALALRIQPNEGIELCLWVKVPGYERKTQQVTMDFSYDTSGGMPEAYEQVLLDAIRGQKELFATSEEILESWRVLDPIQRHWDIQSDDLRFYPKGSGAADILRD